MSLITEHTRRWAARPFPASEFNVGRNDVMRFANAIGATDPVHFDVAAARSAGHPDLLAPPYFPCVVRMHASNLVAREHLEADGSAVEEVPPLELRRAMAGGTEIEFGAAVFAGDTITLRKRIADLYEKQGRCGPMVFVKTEFTSRNQHGELVMRERYTRIYR